MISPQDFSEIKSKLPFYFGPELVHYIQENGSLMDIPENTEILREGQYVKVIPYVLDGVIKVFRKFDERDLLLYYIEPNESCIMSFSASMHDSPSKVFAITEVPTKVLLIPSEGINKWIQQYPDFNTLFYRQYDQRYSELIDTIDHLINQKMDVRIVNFLKQRLQVKGTKTIKITHKQIATEMGTAREVISRIIKKLERDGVIIQHSEGIEVL